MSSLLGFCDPRVFHLSYLLGEMKDCKLYVIVYVNDNNKSWKKKKKKTCKWQSGPNAHMTRLATALLGDSIAIPPNTGIKKWEKKIGKKPLTTKNNNKIKQRKRS